MKPFQNTQYSVEDESIASFSKLNFTDLLNLAIVQVLRTPLDKPGDFAFAVDNLETLLIGDLPNDFYERLKERMQGKDGKLVSRVKFSLLLEVVKKRTPMEVEGSI